MKLSPLSYNIGTDPELFLERDGAIIGSERVIPGGEGLKFRDFGQYPAVVQDGVQIELNFQATTTVASLGTWVRELLALLTTKLPPGTSLNFNSVVQVTKAELDGLSDRSRRFLCAPSFNIYGLLPKEVDPLTYLTRTAGGHLHLGLSGHLHKLYATESYWGLADLRERLVPLCDIFVGTMGVLLDRNPYAPIRRKTYGQAGEYRLPKYGLEYRTLSNFWLRNYSLMSFVFGMANFAVSVLNNGVQGGKDLEDEVYSVVDIKRVIKGIQTNNWNLAYKNYQDIKGFITEYAGTGFPLHSLNLDKFERFVQGVKVRGLDPYFQTNILDSWVNQPQVEFGTFLNGVS